MTKGDVLSVMTGRNGINEPVESEGKVLNVCLLISVYVWS